MHTSMVAGGEGVDVEAVIVLTGMMGTRALTGVASATGESDRHRHTACDV